MIKKILNQELLLAEQIKNLQLSKRSKSLDPEDIVKLEDEIQALKVYRGEIAETILENKLKSLSQQTNSLLQEKEKFLAELKKNLKLQSQPISLFDQQKLQNIARTRDQQISLIRARREMKKKNNNNLYG